MGFVTTRTHPPDLNADFIPDDPLRWQREPKPPARHRTHDMLFIELLALVLVPAVAAAGIGLWVKKRRGNHE